MEWSKKGFTLIEMAIVLVILGLIIGIGTGSMIQFIKWNKRRTTESMVSSAKDYVTGLFSLHPEGINTKQLPKEKDSYAQNLIFILASKITNSYLSSKNATVCDLANTTLEYHDIATNSTLQNVAFVVFSKGKDYQSNTKCNGKLVNNSQTCNGKVETDTSKDIVNVVTLPQLKQYLGCPGNPLHILNNQLPPAYEGEYYNTTLYASGGIKPYHWKLNKTCSWLNGSPSGSYNETYKLNGTPPTNTNNNCYLTLEVKDSNTPPYIYSKKFIVTILTQGNSTPTPQTCSSYTLTVSNKSWVDISVYTTSCQPINSGSIYTKSNLSSSTIVKVYNNIACINLPFLGGEILSGTISSLDTDKDCKAEITCTGLLNLHCNYH